MTDTFVPHRQPNARIISGKARYDSLADPCATRRSAQAFVQQTERGGGASRELSLGSPLGGPLEPVSAVETYDNLSV